MKNEILSISRPRIKPALYAVQKNALSLRFHTDVSVFSTLEKEWTELALQSNQMVCMSSGWAASWWKHLGRHKKRTLCIVTVYDEKKMVAIFPFYEGITKVAGVTLQRRLQLIGSGGNLNEPLGFSDDYGISDFLDVIVHPEYKTSVADLFIKLLDSTRFSGHQIIFHQAREDSYIMQTLYPVLKKKNCNVQAKPSDICPYIKLEESENLQDFIKKSKSNARRRFRQTLRACGPEKEYIIKEPATIADVEQMTDMLIQMHQDRWQKIGFPGAFQDVRFKAFFKEISLTAFRENRLWIKQAVDKSGGCAVRMLLKYNGRYYDYMSGYDDESPSARFRPGIGLLLELVRNSIEQNVDRVELLRGEEGYKYDFTIHTVGNWKISIPETKKMKTGWGLLPSSARFISIIYKYLNREKILLTVQYKKAGFIGMFPEYFKFRINTVKHKVNEFKGN